MGVPSARALKITIEKKGEIWGQIDWDEIHTQIMGLMPLGVLRSLVSETAPWGVRPLGSMALMERKARSCWSSEGTIA